MFNCLAEDCEVVIWAYTVETLSLRVALPEKQSLKRGVATWASAMGNKEAKDMKRRRNEEDMDGGGREKEGEDVCCASRKRIRFLFTAQSNNH
jgi:hypothetical protein